MKTSTTTSSKQKNISLRRNASGMHEYTEQALHNLEEQLGLSINIYTDFDDIRKIDDLAWAITTPKMVTDKLALLDLPTYVGDAALYRLTFGALFWLQEYAEHFFNDSELLMTLAIGYAMAHAHDPDALESCTDRGRALKAIKKWAWRSNIGIQQLDVYIKSVLNADKGDSQEVDYPCLFEMLTADRGCDLQYWLWDCNVETVSILLQAAIEKQNAQSDKTNRQSSVSDKRAAAFVKFKRAVQSYREKKEAEMELAKSDG